MFEPQLFHCSRHLRLQVMGGCLGPIHRLSELPAPLLVSRLGLVFFTQLHVCVTGRRCVVRSAYVVEF